MLGHFGFSYIGCLFLLMLMIPNLLWTSRKPQGYTGDNENNILLLFERSGEIVTSCCACIFADFNIQPWTAWSWWLVAAFVLMVLYEYWWYRYFQSERMLKDFYRSLWIIPLGGATLPVLAFFCLGIYGRVGIMILGVLILSIGHIGIHYQHRKELDHVKN